MPSLPRSSRSRSARSSSIRSRRLSHRDAAQQTRYLEAAQQTSSSESRSSSRRRPASPHNRRPHRTPTPSPTRPSATHPDRKRFGLHVHDNQPRIGKFDFEEKYQEDPVYEELGPNARVWRVNLDECEVYDNDMVVEARDGLDLLLVFAGLFSAVLTTFVAQTSQALSNNFPAVSTSLLLEIVSLQRAFINGTSIDGISSSEMTSGPSGFDVWVNALWFTSLTLSLGTALMAVLVKQWLYQYMSIVSGTARDRSLIRYYRFDGLRKWHVLTIIGTLPIVLHVALGLFLAGLVVFLIPLNVPLASIVGFITAVIYTMYTVSNILPIIYTQCPYRTPFSDILNVLMRPIFTLFSFISSSAPAQALHTFRTSAATSTARLHSMISDLLSAPDPEEAFDTSTSSSFVYSDTSLANSNHVPPSIGCALRTFFSSTAASAMHLYRFCSTTISHLFSRPTESSSNPSTSPKVAFPTLKEAERIAATGDEVAEGIGCDALVWLYQMTSNPPTKSIVLQSLGCISGDSSGLLTAVKADLEKALEAVVHELEIYHWSIRPGQESRAERLLRAQRHIKARQSERHWWWEVDAEAFSPPFHVLASILTSPHTQSVKSRGGKYQNWYFNDLLMHIMQEYGAGHPILLPTTVWQQFLTVIRRDFRLENTDQNLMLCRLAVQSLGNINCDERTAPPFSGGVPITHDTVLLNHIVTDMLPQNNLPSSEFRQLYILNDYVVSELSANRNLVTDDTISILLDIWKRFPIPTCYPPDDSKAICWRAEKCILEVFVGKWWDGLSETGVLHRCHSSVVHKYCYNSGPGIALPSPELFMKLFSELCWSAVVADMSYYTITHILVLVLTQDVESTMACYTFFCGSESPLFSPRTTFPLRFSGYLHSIIFTFVSGLARVPYHQGLIHQCMDSLCVEPDRLFTVCRLLAALGQVDMLGLPTKKTKEVVTESLLKLVRLDPSRDAWQDRKHFLVGIEPWDWPYFSIPKNHKDIGDARDMMQFALEVLDNFFASLENPPNPPPSSPPSELQSESVVRLDSQPPTIVSPWKRVRQLVFTTRTFRYGASSSPADIELADHPSRTSAGVPHHALAIEPPPPSSSNDALTIESAPLISSNAAGKSFSRAIAQPGDDMV